MNAYFHGPEAKYRRKPCQVHGNESADGSSPGHLAKGPPNQAKFPVSANAPTEGLLTTREIAVPYSWQKIQAPEAYERGDNQCHDVIS
jgi:hypothetical protein